MQDLIGFIVVFPYLTVILSAVMILLPLRPTVRRRLVTSTKLAYGFVGWEMFAILLLVAPKAIEEISMQIPEQSGGHKACANLGLLIEGAPEGHVCFGIYTWVIWPVYGLFVATLAMIVTLRFMTIGLHERYLLVHKMHKLSPESA